MRSILDYGSGWKAIHTFRLRRINPDCEITAHDFGRNFVEGLHDARALWRQYDLVFASNVLNVQSTLHALGRTLAEIAMAIGGDGFAVVNYPESPRKMAMGNRFMCEMVFRFFGRVEVLCAGSSPVWCLSNPRREVCEAYLASCDPYTDEEIRAANIRPSGAVGENAVVPAVVQGLISSTASRFAKK